MTAILRDTVEVEPLQSVLNVDTGDNLATGLHSKYYQLHSFCFDKIEPVYSNTTPDVSVSSICTEFEDIDVSTLLSLEVGNLQFDMGNVYIVLNFRGWKSLT